MTPVFITLRGPARWWLPSAIGVLAALALAGSLVSSRWLESALREQVQQQRELRAQLVAGSRVPIPECASEVGYAQALPRTVSIDRLVQSLQDGSRTFGVSLASVSSEPRAQTAHTLAQVEVDIVLRGNYAAVKSALSEALARYPGAVIARLRMRRGAGLPIVEDVDAQIVFPLRPPLPAMDCNPGSNPHDGASR